VLSSAANDMLPADKRQAATEGTLFKEEKSSSEAVQIRNTYVMYQVKSGVMLLDQAAAHERILYERFLGTMSNKPKQGKGKNAKNNASQMLLFPQKVKLSAPDFALLSEIIDALSALGFVVEIGKQQNGILVKGLPTAFQSDEAKGLIEELLEQVKVNQHTYQLPHEENIARTMAKRAAIKHGQAMSAEEMEGMVNQLFACQNPNYSPDGRKTIVMLNMEQLQGLFR
jgi:DNA mismatch repair protein MutL